MIEFTRNLSIIIKLILLINTIDGKNIDGNFSRESDALPIRRTKRLIINGGQDAEIYDFPWMAILLYGEERVAYCAGSLLNQRYILTAAHCVGHDADGFNLTAVRLGEYDRRTYYDCGPSNNNIVCGSVSLEIPVDREIPHEYFKLMGDTGTNHDIALIRLARKVPYRRHIRPINLPMTWNFPDRFWVSGWGEDRMGGASAIKERLEVPYFNWFKCASLYATISIPLHGSNICAGGFEYENVCPGDSGGPLMAEQYISNYRRVWIIYGIVSHGHDPCATPGWPSVFTAVYDHVPWIMEKIEKYDPGMTYEMRLY